MEETPLQFIDTWNMVGQILGVSLAVLSILVVIIHFGRLSAMRDPKKKYDYMNRSEINNMWIASLLFLIGVAVFANSLLSEIGWAWLTIRLFVTLVVTSILLIIVKNLLKFYYPFYMEKRLKKLRYKPRISPKSGKPMKLLSEEEEDVYLDEGMQAEEEVFSIDYDVWIDEETGYTQIEKYAGHLHAERCPDCNYQTYKVSREEIIKEPTSTEEGELTKFYKCGYCGYKDAKNVKIAAKEGGAGTQQATAPAS